MTETAKMSADEKKSENVRVSSGWRKFWKLLFLFVWIGGLGSVSFITITGIVNDFLEKQTQRKTYNDWKNNDNKSLVEDLKFKTQYENATAQQSYNLYREQQFKVNEKLSIQVGQPPVEAILDLATNKNWRNQKCTYKEIGTFATFDRIERILIAFSSEPQIFEGQEINTVSAMIPSGICLKGENSEDSRKVTEIIAISPEIRHWINKESNYRKNRQKAINLFDTFVLLAALGAFGSIIFLINDFMSSEKETRRPIFEYALKPVFGMFLAIATFVIAIGTNGVINPSNVLSVNSQFIYLLGLGSGLLSDTAYKKLVERLSEVFTKADDTLDEKADNTLSEKADNTLDEKADNTLSEKADNALDKKDE